MWPFSCKPQQPRCEHEWHETGTGRKWVEGILPLRSYEHLESVVYTYCPKCDRSDWVFPSEWVRIQREQKIRRDYKEQCRDPYSDDEE
jgi:hypothetical protein